MKKYFLLFLLLLSASICTAQYSTIHKGIVEIPVPGLNDIAVASFDLLGPVIYFAQHVGPVVSAFFQAREYGHHSLGHVKSKLFNANNPYVQICLTQNTENAADKYSIEYHVQLGNRTVLQAAYNNFMSS